MVPDESAQVRLRIFGSEKSKMVGRLRGWQSPFIGGKDIRAWHGDGYALAIRNAYDDVPESADFVMYCGSARRALRAGKLRPVSDSSHQQHHSGVRPESRRAVSMQQGPPIHVFVHPDHPGSRRSQMKRRPRRAMQRCALHDGGRARGAPGPFYTSRKRATPCSSRVELAERRGRIFADLRIGVDVAECVRSEERRMSCRGVQRLAGYRDTEQAASRLGRIDGLEHTSGPI